MIKIIYIAGPYTKGDVAQNVHNAVKVADKIASLGYVPFIPHLTHFWHLVSPHDWEFWLKIDMEILKRCDAVFRLLGESTGADREVKLAMKLGIPVYYKIEKL